MSTLAIAAVLVAAALAYLALLAVLVGRSGGREHDGNP